MSPDEIVFDEVRYREPERRCRPDRDRRLACLAYEVPGPQDLPIFLDRATADAIERHALRDTSVELGGILLGKECLDEQTGQPFVVVLRSLEAKHYENTQASFTYTHESWEEITRERDRLHPDLDIVGWYHTHPDFGIFLSSHDLFIHHHFFAQPLQLAYVVDPVRQTRGFFHWRDGTMVQVGGFTLIAGRGERVALVRLVNDLENIPDTEGGGGVGGLSPRLEAELIAMLTRPAAPPTSTAERTLAAALFGLLGLMAGVLGVLAVLWLNQFARSVQEQTEKVDAMAASVERASAAQRLAFETLLSASKSSDHDPDALLSQYRKTTRDLDEVRHRLQLKETENDALAESNRALHTDREKLRTELGLVSTVAAKYEKDARDAPGLRTRVAALESETREQSRKLAEQEELLDTVEGHKAATMLRRYDRVWYTAALGWGLAFLLALGLFGVFAWKLFPAAEAEAPTPRPDIEETPPHHIT